MRKELEGLSQKVRQYLPEHGDMLNFPFDSPFASSVLLCYQKVGMKCDLMQRFESIVLRFREVADQARNICFQNYKPFSNTCHLLPELWNNDDFYKHRQASFETISLPYLDSPEPLVEVGMALLAEGGYLIRRPHVADKLLSVIVKVQNKIYKWEQPMPSSHRD